MSIDVSAWLSGGAGWPTDVETERAARAWRRIQDKPFSVTFRTHEGTDLDAQVVRLEYDNSASEPESPAGEGPLRKLIIFGIRNHATLPDTVIGGGWRFNVYGRQYTVVDIIPTLGEVQAVAEAVGGGLFGQWPPVVEDEYSFDFSDPDNSFYVAVL